MPPLFGQTTSGQSQALPSLGVSRSYGDVRSQIAEEFPSASLDRIDQLLTGRIHRVIERMRWHQLELTVRFQTVAIFNTGQATFTPGQATITSTTAFWTPAQNGLEIRAAGDSALYTFTYQSPFEAQLDRPYDGYVNGSAGYQILCRFFGFPSIVAEVLRVRNLTYDYNLNGAERSDLDAVDPARNAVSMPTDWAPIEPTGPNGEPLSIQIELCPIPDKIYDMEATVVYDWAALGPQDTGTYFPRFFDCDCLLDGVRANLGPANMRVAQEELFESGLKMMQLADMRRRGPQRAQMHPVFTRHRIKRWTRASRHYYDDSLDQS